MACPTIEEVTRELVRRLQLFYGGVWRSTWSAAVTYLASEVVDRNGTVYRAVASSTGVDPATDNGTHWIVGTRPGVDVFAAGGVTDIEVVDATGAPVIEVQDRPKISIVGPKLRPSPLKQGRTNNARVLVSTDQDALTFTDAPEPLLRELDYQVIATSMRDSTDTAGHKGIMWLEQQLLLVGAGDYLKAASWTGDEAAGRFGGYWFDLTTEPQRIPSQASSLHAFSATITIHNVRVTDGTNGTGPLVGEINLTVEELLEG
jgi:hypothetical protein